VALVRKRGQPSFVTPRLTRDFRERIMIRKTLFATSLLSATLLASTACSAQPAAVGKPFNETVVADFESPWAMTFLPDARMLVTEKKGQMLLVSADGKSRQTIATIKVD